MKNILSAALLSLMFLFSVICLGESLGSNFVVELQQDAGSSIQSFSIKPDPHTLSGNPSYLADINDYGEPILPPDGKSHGLDGYGLKTTFLMRSRGN